ncbi:MAG: hypothetical protein KA436_09755 [Oligoflexales bacterium]|nr:hypothetical protein [Oligoflexales bacterium]
MGDLNAESIVKNKKFLYHSAEIFQTELVMKISCFTACDYALSKKLIKEITVKIFNKTELVSALTNRGFQYKSSSSNQINVRECLFCHDTKSKIDNLYKLYISKDNGAYFCHRCGSKGSFSSLYTKILGFNSSLAQRHEVKSHFKITKRYLYMDDNGREHLRITRLENPQGQKKFFQEFHDGKIFKLGGARRQVQPYRFSIWKNHPKIYLVEGEKCVEAISDLNHPEVDATTTPGGCKNWKQEYANFFTGKVVGILPDNDEPGHQYAQAAFIDIQRVARFVYIVDLPGLDEGEDIFDWIMKNKNPIENLIRHMRSSFEKRKNFLKSAREGSK